MDTKLNVEINNNNDKVVNNISKYWRYNNISVVYKNTKIKCLGYSLSDNDHYELCDDTVSHPRVQNFHITCLDIERLN